MDQETRLNKRFWLIRHLDHLLREAEFAKMHKANFFLPKLLLWKFGQEKGETKVEIT